MIEVKITANRFQAIVEVSYKGKVYKQVHTAVTTSGIFKAKVTGDILNQIPEIEEELQDCLGTGIGYSLLSTINSIKKNQK